MKKKKISLVALDPLAGASYKREVEGLFGEYADITLYCVRDGSASGNLPASDLFVISTDAYGSAEEVARHVPIDSEVMSIEVTFTWQALDEIWKIPGGTKVLLVNVTETMAREAISQLNALGVNHIQFVPYYQGAELDETLKREVKLAITPGESRFVPEFIEKIIDCDHRPCSYGMMIEIALRLGLENLLESDRFKDYSRIVASNHYSFDRMYARATRQESLFHILAESLDEGIIGVNEAGAVFVCNKKACEMTHISGDMVTGKKGEEVFPYIPFYRTLKDKKETAAKIVQLFGTNISLTVIPVLKGEECIGAFATLQSFNDQEIRQNELRGQLLQKGHYAKYTFDDIIGSSQAIIETKNILMKMAKTESPVLLIGETGTGKEIMAHAVHMASGRANKPFIAVNVAAMPENLLESELFGYEEGAFTGARKGGRPGLFEFAHQGTLFLDEVEGMSMSMQVKLLRVLQEGEVMRVGGSNIIHVDVRIVAATNESLEQKIEEGSFRRDLYYRLNALTVEIPPLRQRGDDMFLLLEYFAKRHGGQKTFALSDEVRSFFKVHKWPGNIRELQNAAEYFNYLGKEIIELDDLPPTMKRRDEYNKQSYGSTTAGDLKFPAEEAVNNGNVYSAEALPKTYRAYTNDADNNMLSPARYFESREAAEEFALRVLKDAAAKQLPGGRDRIISAAKAEGYVMTQKRAREILKGLQERGYVAVGKGRNGSMITEAGMRYLK